MRESARPSGRPRPGTCSATGDHRTDTTRAVADAVVVGAGGAGAVAAYELASAGLSVVVLEAGSWLDPDRDFTRLEDDMGSFAGGRLRWGPGDRVRGPWRRVRDGVGAILQASGVGGTTLHYNGISPRAYQGAFAEWPFPYPELARWYERVEEFLPVHLVSALAPKDELFAFGCERIGLTRSEAKEVTSAVWRPCHNAILPIVSPDADREVLRAGGCTMCGHCLIGCRNPVAAPLDRKAKRAKNVSYVPAAVATGRCEIIPDAFATRILWERASGRARARGIRYRATHSGATSEIDARVVVLAGGSIESPRLWLGSGLPEGVAGRHLTVHYQDFVTGFFDREVGPDVGQVSMARADFPGYGTMFTQGFGPQAFAAVVAASGEGFWDDDQSGRPWDIAGRSWGAEALAVLKRYRSSLTVTTLTDDESVASNFVGLARDWPPDENGPIPRVRYRPTRRSSQRREWLVEKAALILRAAGATLVHRAGPIPLLTHIMCTMRIGNDPSTSVFDAGGEAHAVAGLFIADTSALPNGLGGPNPTLTAQALAARTSHEIIRRLS